ALFVAFAFPSLVSKGVLGESAIDYLSSSGAEHVLLDTTISTSSTKVAKSPSPLKLPPGPYLATSSGNVISFSTVYRLYSDDHDNFLYGSYEPNDGTGSYTAIDHRFPGSVFATIPVPSRLYSLYDTRPFAGFRVGVKDLFDMKGLKASGGSLAWQSIQIIELGGVLSWEDFNYPFNPRGDGYLSCSASSSSSTCAVAAYDWLDYAIGTDTGESMRHPAAVSGIYSQRPSQGMISLENVLPLGFATNTASIFTLQYMGMISRETRATHFAKHWYAPSLHQSSDITGLSPLEVPDNKHYPKTILYPTDYLPRLVSTWAARYGGRFPPIEAEFRASWATYDEMINTMPAYNAVMIYDIRTGGLPSYREEELNVGPNATRLAVPSPRAVLLALGICTIFACANFTVPIGQVPYLSQVTFVEEMIPVTVNLVVRRECDFVLYNIIKELADVGVLKAVKTGRTAFYKF
ncbi:amidase signature enzyme, partial [Lindgomyces ingoldianus]